MLWCIFCNWLDKFWNISNQHDAHSDALNSIHAYLRKVPCYTLGERNPACSLHLTACTVILYSHSGFGHIFVFFLRITISPKISHGENLIRLCKKRKEKIWGVEGGRVLSMSRRRRRRSRRRSRNSGSKRGQIMQGQRCRWAAAVQGEQALG